MEPGADGAAPAPVSATKRALLVLSHAMERAFDTAPPTGDRPGLVLGLFQLREHFDVEAARYASLAAAGHTVVVAFGGGVDDLPAGVHAVALPEGDPRRLDWVLVAVRGAYVTALVATDVRTLSPSELTLEASRSFLARWTFRRRLALVDAREQLDRLAPDLPPQVVAEALAHIEHSHALPVSPGELQLAVAADHLIASVDRGQRRATSLRLALAETQSMAERDQLTGLYNRHHLERFLGADDRPADLLVLLVDADGLKTLNDVHGHDAGDKALQAVAAALVEHSRPGDVCVRWGGDEFLLLAPFVSGEAGLAFAERLVTAVRSTSPAAPFEHLHLSVSIGVCASARTVLPLAELDAALHTGKRTGKGRAVLARAVDGPGA
ncbi:MAG: Response regulator PleD [Frankiales bacterium]|nr:Response regulator PleD [Frankiales bacterium]